MAWDESGGIVLAGESPQLRERKGMTMTSETRGVGPYITKYQICMVLPNMPDPCNERSA